MGVSPVQLRPWAALAKLTLLLVDAGEEGVLTLLVAQDELLVVFAVIKHGRKFLYFPLLCGSTSCLTFLADGFRVWRQAVLVGLGALPSERELPARLGIISSELLHEARLCGARLCMLSVDMRGGALADLPCADSVIFHLLNKLE